MGKGFKDSSIIGGALDRDVLVQLVERTKIVEKKTNRSTKEISYLNSKTGWVKLSSSVNVFNLDNGFSSNLAKNNVLFGGVTPDRGNQKSGLPINNNTNSAYTRSNISGFRPMPGITNVTINSKNTFGTLREAKVEFSVWSVEELSNFEKLYMRPGYTVLLEWGNSMYVDNKGKINSNVETVSQFFSNKFINKKKELQGAVNQIKTKSGYNYDGFYGYVKNFQWSYNIDGGYDCSCDIITHGELIESIKVIVAPEINVEEASQPTGKTKSKETTVKPDIKSIKTILHVFLHSIKTPKYGGTSYTGKSEKATLEKECPSLYKSFVKDLDGRFFNVKEIFYKSLNNETSNKFKYIKLRDLLILVNNCFMYEGKNRKRLIEFNTNEFRSFFYTFRNHSSIDLAVGFNPKDTEGIKLQYKGLSKELYLARTKDIEEYSYREIDVLYKNFSQKEIQKQRELVYKNIPDYDPYSSMLNLHINIDLILKELNNILKKGQVTEQSLLSFVNNILNKLQKNLGDINDFDIYYDEDLFQYFVVDRILVPDKVESKINLTGLKSITTNLTFSSKITPKLASMIAISAQAGGSDVGIDTENMFRWNSGLSDRLIPEKALRSTNFEGSNIDTLAENIRSLSEFVNKFNKREEEGGKNYNAAEISSFSTIHSSVMRKLAITHTSDNKSGATGVIPFELSITLDGISGIKVGQAFKIEKGILPDTYDDVIAFLVNKVDHTISNNRWETSLGAQTIVISPKPSGTIPADSNLIKEIVNVAVKEAEIFDPYVSNPNPDVRIPVDFLQYDFDLLNFIKKYEGFEKDAYYDPGSLGKPITIGYGTTVIDGAPIAIGQTITEKEAEQYLIEDVSLRVRTVKKLVKVDLTQGEFNALVSFTYNVGSGNLESSTLLKLINEESYIAASEQFLRWTKASGKQLKGLLKRRQEEKQVFLRNNPGDPK